MKKFLNTTIKIKHVLMVLVLFVGLIVGAIINKPKHQFPRYREMTKMERPQMRNHFNRGKMEHFKNQFNQLGDVEKASIDSLKRLIKRGDWENNKVIIEQIREIVKGD